MGCSISVQSKTPSENSARYRNKRQMPLPQRHVKHVANHRQVQCQRSHRIAREKNSIKSLLNMRTVSFLFEMPNRSAMLKTDGPRTQIKDLPTGPDIVSETR